VKVVVTGAGGMLARAAIPALETRGHAVLGLTRADADVTLLEPLTAAVARFHPDWVWHLAAFTQVDECESRPDHAHLVNALGARHAALASAACGAALLAVSTDYVFDGEGTRPYREYDAAAPRSVYGASKWAGEEAVREVQPRHLIVRTSWLYGRGGPNFVDTILRKARAGEALRVVDDQRGSPTWTRDLAEGLARLMETGQAGTFHCTNTGDCTWYDLAALALERAGVRASLARTDSAAFPRPARRPAYSVLDHQFFEHVTGHRMPPWQDALSRYLESEAAVLAGARKEGP
jgi:dTDP-4-dehydrorhamnose reductase